MVYCNKCGTRNPDEAQFCSNCGAALHGATNPQNEPQNQPYWHHHYHDHYYRGGSGIGLLIAGLIVIVIGLALLYNQFGLLVSIFWPVVIILIGVWLLIRAVIRNRRYSQPPPT